MFVIIHENRISAAAAAIFPIIPAIPVIARVLMPAAIPAIKSGLQASKATSRGVGPSGDPKVHLINFNSAKKAEEAARRASSPLGLNFKLI